MNRILVRASLVFAVLIFTFGMSSVFAETGVGNPSNSLGTIDDPRLSRLSDQEQGEEYMPNAVLVMFKSTKNLVNNSAGKKAVNSILGNSTSNISVNDIWSFRNSGDLVTTGGKKKVDRQAVGKGRYQSVALIRSNRYSTNQLISMFKKRPDVISVEPNYKVHATSVSDDAYSDYQWSMQDGENTPNVTSQWNKGNEKPDDIVAVLDTGIDPEHPDLKDNLWENDNYPRLHGEYGFNFIDPTAKNPMDDNGHGTHVAGIIGAVGDNGEGISGVDKHIKIMALKTLDENGSAYMSHEIDAYNYIDIALDLGEPVRAINNSWSGGDDSIIFAELVDIVGEKGAVTVCAAGNDGQNNDEFEDYPASIESPYIVSVAATQRDGKLADYSNYGVETVDVAAPGSEVLSTICYQTYNPTLYREDPDKQEQINDNFNDFEEDTNTWGIPYSGEDAGKIYINGEECALEGGTYKADDSDAEINLRSSEGFLGTENSMYLEMNDLAKKDIVCITVPYKLGLDATAKPILSIMGRASGPEFDFDDESAPVFAITDIAASESKGFDSIKNRPIIGRYIDGENTTFDHFEIECPADDSEDIEEIIKEANGDPDADVLKREAIILVYAPSGGDYKISVDDIGMSRQADLSKKLEQYDFMSGTSMAAPYISGAIALKAAELDEGAEGGKVDVESLINNTVSLAKDVELPVNQGGSFDFSVDLKGNLPPRIGKVTVNKDKKEITIHGSALKDARVEIGGYDDEGNDDLEEVTPRSTEDKKIVIEDRGWINNVETIKVTKEINGKQRSSQRRDVYLVKGKKTFNKLDVDLEAPNASAMTTDGGNIIWSESSNRTIYMTTITNDIGYTIPMCEVDPEKIFKGKSRKNGEYGMVFGDDIATIDGTVYTVLEYGLTHTAEGDETEWGEAFADNSRTNSDGFIFEDIVEEGESGLYSSELRLICTRMNDMEEYEAVDLGTLPKGLEQTANWTMASYNGKLYFMGGFSYAKGNKGLTDKVYIFDPAAKKGSQWSESEKALPLPEKRAGGKAIQTGKYLIYTMGYSPDNQGVSILEQTYPSNLIFDGKSWKVSKAGSIEPYIIDDTVSHKGDVYLASQGSIGIIKGGIVYMGMPVYDLGDTFAYYPDKDAYSDTGYNFIDLIDAFEMNGIVVGPNMYGFEDDDVYKINVPSGLISVNVSKTANGSISGSGAYMPGTTVKSTVKARKNFRIKTLKLNGKKVKLAKNTTTKVLTLKTITEDQYIASAYEKYKFKVKVKKKGKGKVTGGKTYIKGKTATIKVKAAKGYYIKSIKQGKKKIKVKKNATSKKFKIKKIKKDWKVTVVFAKKKK